MVRGKVRKVKDPAHSVEVYRREEVRKAVICQQSFFFALTKYTLDYRLHRWTLSEQFCRKIHLARLLRNLSFISGLVPPRVEWSAVQCNASRVCVRVCPCVRCLKEWHCSPLVLGSLAISNIVTTIVGSSCVILTFYLYADRNQQLGVFCVFSIGRGARIPPVIPFAVRNPRAALPFFHTFSNEWMCLFRR